MDPTVTGCVGVVHGSSIPMFVDTHAPDSDTNIPHDPVSVITGVMYTSVTVSSARGVTVRGPVVRRTSTREV